MYKFYTSVKKICLRYEMSPIIGVILVLKSFFVNLKHDNWTIKWNWEWTGNNETIPTNKFF